MYISVVIPAVLKRESRFVPAKLVPASGKRGAGNYEELSPYLHRNLDARLRTSGMTENMAVKNQLMVNFNADVTIWLKGFPACLCSSLPAVFM